MLRSAIQRCFGGLSKNTFLIAQASLFSDISTEMLYPVLPVFLTQTPGATGSIVGLVDISARNHAVIALRRALGKNANQPLVLVDIRPNPFCGILL